MDAIKHVEAQFVVGTLNKENIRMIYETGDCATMDMGCYTILWLRHISRQEPTVTRATAVKGDPQIDLRLEVEYELEGGATNKTIGSMSDADLRLI